MLHHFLLGLIIGWGVAIPIGPMNLEIIRRNLRFGTPYGIAIGFGACTADITYLALLSVGAIAILNHPTILNTVGILGSAILAWFGYNALKLKTNRATNNNQPLATYPLWRHTLEGFAITLLSPFTILFWLSISSQIAILAKSGKYAGFCTGLGVLIGTTSWDLALNTFLHFTRHRLSERTMHLLNILGGLILIGFALFGLIHTMKNLDLAPNL